MQSFIQFILANVATATIQTKNMIFELCKILECHHASPHLHRKSEFAALNIKIEFKIQKDLLHFRNYIFKGNTGVLKMNKLTSKFKKQIITFVKNYEYSFVKDINYVWWILTSQFQLCCNGTDFNIVKRPNSSGFPRGPFLINCPG